MHLGRLHGFFERQVKTRKKHLCSCSNRTCLRSHMHVPAATLWFSQTEILRSLLVTGTMKGIGTMGVRSVPLLPLFTSKSGGNAPVLLAHKCYFPTNLPDEHIKQAGRERPQLVTRISFVSKTRLIIVFFLCGSTSGAAENCSWGDQGMCSTALDMSDCELLDSNRKLQVVKCHQEKGVSFPLKRNKPISRMKPPHLCSCSKTRIHVSLIPEWSYGQEIERKIQI